MFHDINGFDPAQAGYRMAYRPHETNHCPGCGNTQWIVGRAVAECAFCSTALPMNEGVRKGERYTAATPAYRRSPPDSPIRCWMTS